MARHSALAEKLTVLADRAREFQLRGGTTAPTLNHLPENRKTTRQTISLVLTSGERRALHFIFHREPMPQKAVAPGQPISPPTYRAAIFGGGVESDEERRLRELTLRDPLLMDPLLLDESGGFPPDAWYRLQGKHFLGSEMREPGNGRLLQMTYPVTPQTVQAFIRDELSKRLKMEAGAATPLIGEPVVLRANPVETAVLNRRLGSYYTEAIGQRTGMTVNERGELVGIGILVQERFTMAELLCAPRRFTERARGNALVWSADQLVANAERDTRDFDAWKNRLAHQDSDDRLPIRNHSLLVGSAAAAQHLSNQSGLLAAAGHLWARLRGKHLSVAA